MARPRQFDEEQALEQAIRVFWTKGYRETSVDDLMEAMGIRKGSFYNTFRSKEDVFRRALTRYARFPADYGAFTDPSELPEGLDGLMELLSRFLDNLVDPAVGAGCFLAVAAVMDSTHELNVSELALPGIEGVRTRIQAMIEQAQQAGNMNGQDPESLSLLMISVAYGMQVLRAAGYEMDDLKSGAGELRALLERS